MRKAYVELTKRLCSEKVRLNEPLAKHTTFKIGGPADIFFEADDSFSLLNAVVQSRELGIPFVIFGGGSNILVSDKGFRGLVISNQKGHIQQVGKEHFEISSGVKNRKVIDYIVKNSLTGLEFLVGIPGTIGGAIRVNAHFRSPQSFQEEVREFHSVKDQFIHDFVEDVLILTNDNSLRRVNDKYIQAAYHQTRFKKTNDLIVSVRMKLKHGNNDLIRQSIKEHLLWRKSRKIVQPDKNINIKMPLDFITMHRPSQPKFPTPGCMFSNTPNKDNHPISRLLDMCGLKEKRIGDAMIAKEHANYIVNIGNGKAADALSLIQLCQKTIYNQFNVKPELEIDLIGEF